MQVHKKDKDIKKKTTCNKWTPTAMTSEACCNFFVKSATAFSILCLVTYIRSENEIHLLNSFTMEMFDIEFSIGKN